MSVSARVLAANSRVARDFGLLQAHGSSVKPFPTALEGDETAVDDEEDTEADEHDEFSHGIRRFRTANSAHNQGQSSSSGLNLTNDRSGRRSLSRGRLASDHLPRLSAFTATNHQDTSDTTSVFSITSLSTSHEPSHARTSSRRVSQSPAPSRPMSLVRSTSGPMTGRLSFLQPADTGNESTGTLASRYRDLILGGEPIPPPIEQVQQHYLQQHSIQDHAENLPPSGGVLRMSFNPELALVREDGLAFTRELALTRPQSDLKTLERTWTSASAVVPRMADVAQVIEELHLQGAAPTDEESPSYSLNERFSLLSARPMSYAATGHSGLTVRTAVPGDHGQASYISMIPAPAPTLPGPKAAKQEFFTLLSYTLPVWATHVLELSINTITVLVISHIGTTELAAASLASLSANVTGYAIVAGFVCAMDTLGPVAWSSERPWTVGLWAQRMVIVLAVLLLPISILWLFAEEVLLALNQDAEVSHLAAQYMRIIIFSLPAYAGFETSRRYLQAQGLFSAPTIAVGVASIFNVPLQLLLVYGPDPICFGFLGAPIASTISFNLMWLFNMLQCWLAPRTAWDGLSLQAFDLPSLLVVWKLGLASTLSLWCEWFAYELAGLLTSTLGTTALATQSVLLLTCSLTYQLPSALGVAAAVRSGNLLGANQPAWAALTARVALASALLCGLFNSSLLIILRNHWGRAFSSDPKLVSWISALLPFLGMFQVFDSLCAVSSGILRGSGRQSIGVVFNGLGYYGIGLEMSCLLLFKFGWGLQGIWSGLAIGLFLASAGFVLFILQTDWNAEADRVLARMQEEELPAAMVEANLEAQIEAVLEEELSIAEEDEGDLSDEGDFPRSSQGPALTP